jgi:hypothetical protein
MSKVKVTTRFKIVELIDRFIDGATANALGSAIVDEAKKLIASGQSPVRGQGRFEVYSDSYKRTLRGKRGRELAKTVRPVNLKATGEMLEGYGARRKDGSTIEVGMVKGSAKRKEIAGYHNEGAGKLPARPIVPGEGEEFAVSIMRKIRDLYGERLRKLIAQSNKK